jgi:hypothetical protein
MTQYDWEPVNSTRKRRWRWAAWGALVFAILAVTGIQIALTMFSRWSEVRNLSSEDAAREFSIALNRAGGGTPYVEIAPGGGVIVHRDQENDELTPLATLHLLAWEPDSGKLVRIDFPFWFIRVKMNDTINLGTITSALAGDWENLDLEVSVDELERRGPAVVIDHTLPEGSRILLWTEKASEDARETP